MGVFWRTPPSMKSSRPMRTGGKRMGMAAEASACRGPTSAPRTMVRGGAVVGSVPSGPVCMKMTVRPEATSVAETLSAVRCPCRSVRAMARQGISRSMRRAMGVTSKRPAASAPPPSSTRCMLIAWRTPKPSTPARLISVHRSMSRRMPWVGSARCAARKQALMAPTEVPQRMSMRGGAPRSLA